MMEGEVEFGGGFWGPLTDEQYETLGFAGLVHGTYGEFRGIRPRGEIQIVHKPRHWWSLKRKVETLPIIVTQYDEDWDGAITIDFEMASVVPTFHYIWRWQRG